jgi:hypothetical protein
MKNRRLTSVPARDRFLITEEALCTAPVLDYQRTGEKYIISWMNICRIQRHIRAKMMVVHLDGLAPYLGATRDE